MIAGIFLVVIFYINAYLAWLSGSTSADIGMAGFGFGILFGLGLIVWGYIGRRNAKKRQGVKNGIR